MTGSTLTNKVDKEKHEKIMVFISSNDVFVQCIVTLGLLVKNSEVLRKTIMLHYFLPPNVGLLQN